MFWRASRLPSRSFGPTLLATMLLVGLCAPHVEAVKSDLKVDAKRETDGGRCRFATIPGRLLELGLAVENANIVVKRVPGISEISLWSNCPRNWNVQKGLVRQCGFSSQRKGTALLADALGSRAIVNGRVYLFAPGPMKGLQLGAQGVFINGQEVEPLKGSDVTCNCAGEDVLEVRIPESYNGSLKVACANKSSFELNNWREGNLECLLMGESTFSGGKLDSLSKAVFDLRGNAKAEIEDLSTKTFVANIAGNGQIVVKHGKADISNATVAGAGKIILSGEYKNMQKSVEGSGSVEVNP
ncbi:MAG: DUF2807 domain-containing protein [Candidatus Obscuribacterales bacterium]|nr:DUF2807 domain-containing protein [Candidatus Obscuribacterales bacterium]